MKIAIMGAMPEEVAPILERLDDVEEVNYAKNRYYKAKYKDIDVVVAYSKIGKVFSTLTAATMLQMFACDVLLFTGVAGAVNPELKIGDLVVANKLAQHDLDITIFGHPHGYVPEGSVYIEADKDLIALSKIVASEMGVNVKEGIIATGDQFIASEERKNFIAETFKADALEMEGASVAVVCDALGVPFFILRSISDSADMDAGFNFEEFVESSAKVSAEFLMKMVDRLANA
ncbi:5'-methylthioadenosine/adenosylhomocysteine nucleosidase [Sulfurimonas paralvinellae]|uniref:adenosylhomocysteine nucleosidase n=1 Tax=Sulfurimonas paralvinellae TaxID=317658 RepID=A0A7M1B6S7_9BACT|nr:5'-methylthioadenosine/adenosylhomocysteine nucleosidase [Sulfurimonas paralvinellae]QOP45355.1 5'-methylthioadenosine/adenosylhomocysteine nucleosidase [Sulfurimonas paralvinellae]